jgi:CIC family chloride channel protein
MLGQDAVMALPDIDPPSLDLMPVFCLVGLAAALLGMLFNRALLVFLDYFSRVFAGRGGNLALWLLVGLVVGTLGWLEPVWVGSGERLAQAGLLMGGFDVMLTTTRFFLTLFSYAIGTPGGIFAPLLVLGSQMGALVGVLTGLGSHPSLVIVGMAALVTASVQAPVTAVLLLLEMSGRYAMIFPLTVACGLSFVTARALGATPIFDQLMERDRLRYQAEQAAAEAARMESPDSSHEQTP